MDSFVLALGVLSWHVHALLSWTAPGDPQLLVATIVATAALTALARIGARIRH